MFGRAPIFILIFCADADLQSMRAFRKRGDGKAL
jgi:hypothetical protein